MDRIENTVLRGKFTFFAKVIYTIMTILKDLRNFNFLRRLDSLFLGGWRNGWIVKGAKLLAERLSTVPGSTPYKVRYFINQKDLFSVPKYLAFEL